MYLWRYFHFLITTKFKPTSRKTSLPSGYRGLQCWGCRSGRLHHTESVSWRYCSCSHHWIPAISRTVVTVDHWEHKQTEQGELQLLTWVHFQQLKYFNTLHCTTWEHLCSFTLRLKQYYGAGKAKLRWEMFSCLPDLTLVKKYTHTFSLNESISSFTLTCPFFYKKIFSCSSQQIKTNNSFASVSLLQYRFNVYAHTDSTLR